MSDNSQLPPNVLERLEKAEQLKLSGKNKEALLVLEELVLEDPSNVSALEEIADNELSLEQFSRAKTAADRAVALDPSSYTGHYILGFLLSAESKWTEAYVRLKEANRLKSNNPEILRCLGWVLFQSGQRPQGVVTLERSLNLDSENTLTLCDLRIWNSKTFQRHVHFFCAPLIWNRATCARVNVSLLLIGLKNI
jgi:predicted Zn-dependent protease